MAPDAPIPEALRQHVFHPATQTLGFTLEHNDLARNCPLDGGHHSLEPNHDLGILDHLPLEILTDVLVQIDLRSLVDFRRLNKRAMQVVDSLRPFQAIMEYSPDSLRGVLAIGSASWVSCLDLFATLEQACCEQCNEFGGYIYLPTCARVCFLCFSGNRRYLPLLESEAIRLFGLKRSLMPSLNRVWTVPGNYCYEPRNRDRICLIDRECARRAGLALHGSPAAIARHLNEVTRQSWERYNEKLNRRARWQPRVGLRPTPHRLAVQESVKWNLTGFPRDSEDGGRAHTPRPPREFGQDVDFRATDTRRYTVVVRAPWMDVSTKSAEWGFHCRACWKYGSVAPPLSGSREYYPTTFEEHLLQCGPFAWGPRGTWQHDTARIGH